MQTLVIRKTLSRLPRSASPSHSSERPLWYSQQLSKKSMPASIASWTRPRRVGGARQLAQVVAAHAQGGDLDAGLAQLAARDAARGGSQRHLLSGRKAVLHAPLAGVELGGGLVKLERAVLPRGTGKGRD